MWAINIRKHLNRSLVYSKEEDLPDTIPLLLAGEVKLGKYMFGLVSMDKGSVEKFLETLFHCQETAVINMNSRESSNAE